MKVTMEHGERYGQLTVLHKAGRKWRCGCACGNSRFFVRANNLMKGRVKHCDRPVHGAN